MRAFASSTLKAMYLDICPLLRGSIPEGVDEEVQNEEVLRNEMSLETVVQSIKGVIRMFRRKMIGHR